MLVEIFKYLYLLFSEEKDLVVLVNEYIFIIEVYFFFLVLFLVNVFILEIKVRKFYKYDILIVMWDIVLFFRLCISYYCIFCNKIERIDFICVII